MSAKIGTALWCSTATGVARNENAEVMTSSPGPTPAAARAMWMAAVPPLHASEYFVPTNAANSCSGAKSPSSVERAQSGPRSSTFMTACLSASVTIGQAAFRVESTTGRPPRNARVSVISLPGPHTFVHEPAQLASCPQCAGCRKPEAELKQPELVVAPRVRNALLHVPLNRVAHGRLGRAGLELDAEFDRVAIAGSEHPDLPVARDAGHVVEQLLEEPGAEVAHAAVDHFVRASAN